MFGFTGVAIGYAGAFRYFFAEYFFRQGQIHQNDWDDQRSACRMAPAEALCWLAVKAELRSCMAQVLDQSVSRPAACRLNK